MPLSSKLQADYVEMINKALDAVPVTESADFELVITQFNEILSNEKAWKWFVFDQALIDAIKTVAEFLEHPDDYVESRDDYAEYQKIIRGRIAAKIAEFSAFTLEQKHQYAANQKMIRSRAARDQALILKRQKEMGSFFRKASHFFAEVSRFFTKVSGFFRRLVSTHTAHTVNVGKFDSPPPAKKLLVTGILSSLPDNTKKVTAVPVLRLREPAAAPPELRSTVAEPRENPGVAMAELKAGTAEEASVFLGGSSFFSRMIVVTPQADLLKFVASGRLTEIEVARLTDMEVGNLREPNVVKLIDSGALTVEEARALTMHQRIRFHSNPRGRIFDKPCRNDQEGTHDQERKPSMR